MAYLGLPPVQIPDFSATMPIEERRLRPRHGDLHAVREER